MEKIYFEKQEEQDIYSRGAREHLIEDDEISDAEAAFMEGYENA